MLIVASLVTVSMLASAALAQKVANPDAVPCSEILTTVQGQPNSATLYQVRRFGEERVRECIDQVATEQPEPSREEVPPREEGDTDINEGNTVYILLTLDGSNLDEFFVANTYFNENGLQVIVKRPVKKLSWKASVLETACY